MKVYAPLARIPEGLNVNSPGWNPGFRVAKAHRPRRGRIKPCYPCLSVFIRGLILCCAVWFAILASGAPSKFPCPENEIASYTAFRVQESITVDGRLDEPAWKSAPRSPRFVDIITGQPTIHD